MSLIVHISSVISHLSIAGSNYEGRYSSHIVQKADLFTSPGGVQVSNLNSLRRNS